MPAIDSCEPQIIRALQKDGWRIAEKPHLIRTKVRYVYADFSVQRSVNGHLEQALIVEVKCFHDPDKDLIELYIAVGQYEFYRSALKLINEVLPVYLAVPRHAYERLMVDTAMQATLQNAQIRMVIIDIDNEEVVQWLH